MLVVKSIGKSPLNFGGLEPEYAEYAGSSVVIVPVPFEATTTYRAGTRDGPLAIIRASREVEFYDEDVQGEPYLVGIHTLDEPELSVATLERPHAQLEQLVADLVQDGKLPVLLGGEHSISLGPVRALSRRFPDLTVLQLDAHADMRDEYWGTPYSHACIARRISEICPIVQVGVRSFCREEAEFLRQGQEERMLRAADLISGKQTFAETLAKLGENVYITIDLDVFDPSEMPAVGTPEPGGLGWYQVLDILRHVFASRNVVGFDLVELCPLSGNVAPEFLAAKLVYKMIGMKFGGAAPMG
ncbi:MAG: agmatinase [Chloroflexi bacterium]|nr:agmatinase [Chloroflexota bacterium]